METSTAAQGLRAGAWTTAAACLLGAGLLLATATTARADTAYTASGQADGFFLTLSNSAVPLVTAVEGGGPTAQATLDSLDQSAAFASFPYPGEEETGVPGLLGSILGLPVPGYPAYVTTSFGQPPATKDLPGINLRASSSHILSTATATAGGSGATKAESTVASELESDGSVTTTASAHVDALTVGGVLQISGMQSEAVATRSPTGALTTSSHLSFGQISVPGLSLSLPATLNLCPINQLPVSGIPAIPCPAAITAVPVPGGLGGTTITAPDIGFEDGQFTVTLPQLGNQKVPVPAATVLAAFKAAGTDVSYQAAQTLKNGIIAPGLTVHQLLPASPVALPPNPALGTPGPTDLTMVFGRSSATVDLTAFDTGADAGASIPLGSGTVGTPAAQTGSGSATAGGTPVSGATPGGVSSSLPDASSVDGTTSGDVPPVVADGATPGTSNGSRLTASRAPLELDSSNLYLFLVGAGLLALGATQAVRIMGVRKLWAS